MVHFWTPRIGLIYTPYIGPINIGHEISPKESRSENQRTWHITGRHYYLIAATQWRMVHFGTPWVGPIQTPNIGPIDEGLISWNLTLRIPLRKSMHMTYHTTTLLQNSCGPMADSPLRDSKSRSYPHPKFWTNRWRFDIYIGHGISPIKPC